MRYRLPFRPPSPTIVTSVKPLHGLIPKDSLQHIRPLSDLCRLLVFILGSVAMPCQVAAHRPRPFDRNKLDPYLNELHEAERFMATVAIDSAGSHVYDHSVGFISTTGCTLKSDGRTIYRLGSITKTFTAVMIVQLIEEDKLLLSPPL